MAVIMAEQRSQAAVFYALWSCLVDGFGQGESVSGIKGLRIVTHKTIENMTRNNYKTACFLPITHL